MLHGCWHQRFNAVCWRFENQTLAAFESCILQNITGHTFSTLFSASRQRFRLPNMPKEEDVGVTEWTNDLPGFTGILKQRCECLIFTKKAIARDLL